MNKISVVVPIKNEAKTLEELHGRLVVVLEKIGKDFEIIFVDDGSKDESFKVMKSLRPLKVVRLRRNFGQSTALGVGFSLAEGDIIITIEADLELLPEDIPALLDRFDEGFDMAIGWRQKRWEGSFFSRYLPSYFANKLISSISKTSLHDNGCMLRIYRRDILKNVNMTGERHRMFASFVALEGGKIVEVPVGYAKRRFGKSNYGITRTFKVLLDLLAFHFFRKYATRPIHFFGGTGFVSLFLGFLVFIWATYMKFFEGVHYNRSPLLTLLAILVVVGFQFILMGLLAEIVAGNQSSSSSQSSKEHYIKEVAENK